MKQNIINYLIKYNFIYNLVIKLFANRIIRETNKLTPNDLLIKGWVNEKGYYTQSLEVKVTHKIYIEFEHHYYRLYYGPNKTFIALRDNKEWFEMFYMLVNDMDQMYKLAGI